MSGDLQQPDERRPVLWNPTAAAWWSVLLTPAFGAYLHASNWRTLGRPDRAASNMTWVWFTLGIMVLALGTSFLPNSPLVDGVARYFGIWLLIGWYAFEGKGQLREVNASFPDGYTKRRWGKPLALGAALMGGYFGIWFLMLVARQMYRRS